MTNEEKIVRTMTRIKLGQPVVKACKDEGLAPPVLYKSDDWKAFKADQADAPEPEAEAPEGFQPYLKITRLPASDDPRAPLFKIEAMFAGDVKPGEHFFTTVQAMVAQLPQLTFGLTP